MKRHAKLRIDFGPGKVTADQLLGMLESSIKAFGRLDSVEVARISRKNPYYADVSGNGTVTAVAHYIREGRQILAGKASTARVSDELVHASRAIAHAADRYGASITFEVPRAGKLSVNTERAEKVREAIERRVKNRSVVPMRKGEEYASDVTGILLKIEASDPRRDQFVIQSRITGQRVKCVIDPDDAETLKEAIASFKKRVRVTGLVRYGSNGPASIKVQKLERLPEKFIRYADMKPIDIAGGQDAADYIRELRDG